MKVRIRRFIPLIVLAIVIGGYIYMDPLLPIITGYSAKNLASGVFVAGRTQESMEATDLNFSFIKFNSNKIDWENKTVKSRFLWGSSKAIVVDDGYGCSLVNDYKPGEMKDHPWPEIKILPENPDTIPWPMGDLISDTIPSEVDKEKLNAVLNEAFADTIPSKGTFAVMVVYKGQPVAERYKDGLTPDNKFLSWSMAKSFTNAIVGILVKDSLIDIHQPLGFEEWADDEREPITLNYLMHINSGLKWNEDYGNNSDVNIMLHKIGDMGQYTLEKPYQYPADSVWIYSSGSTNIVCKYLREKINNDAAYYAIPRERLFNKIGMRSAVWEVDASGTFVGSSYLYATMRDYARFGLLFLNKGNWLGEQILPEGWVDYVTTEAKGSDGQYGAFFWLNLSGKDYPDVPRDMFCCRGHDGQYIYIVPSKELVVVRTGFSKKGEFDYNKFLSGIVESIDTKL
ncbi:MAG: serine hydrolase [Prolixibacteraceae bacterium]|nr:serine hydrolase [Prolixibacteraceae bacterium]